jgi:hypothetical protein
LLGFVIVVVVLNVVAAAVWDGTGPSETTRGDIARILHVLSWCPAFLGVMCAIVPESVVRISPRGIWYATSRSGVLPGRTKRWHARWEEISALKWQGARSEFKCDRKRRSVHFLGWNPPKSPPINIALHMYLSRYFDLSEGTVNQRLTRKWRAWSWKRKLLDKILLVLLVCGLMSYLLLLGYGAGYVLLPTLGLFAFLLATGGMIAYIVRLSRFGWQSPVSRS